MSDFVLVESPTNDEFPTDENTANGATSTKDEQTAPTLKPDGKNKISKSRLAFLDAHPFVRSSVTEKIYVRFAPRAWTDDTDQALLILLSYLQRPSNPTNLPQDFAHRLHIWTSHGLLALNRPPCGIGALVSSIVKTPTYLEDPASAATATWLKSGRNVAPNGSLMRTHPIGIIGVVMSEFETFDLAATVSKTTHADPRCTVSVLVVVALIRGLLRGEVRCEEHIDGAIASAYGYVLSSPALISPSPDEPHIFEQAGGIPLHLSRSELSRHVVAASFDELDLDDRREMGYVYKCLGSAILCLRKCMRATGASLSPSKTASPIPSQALFEDIMTELIMQGGDANTNGAVAGALMGAYLGHAYLPAHWATGLAHREWLDEKILRLCKVIGVLEGEVREEADEQPDCGKGLMSTAELEARDRAMLLGIMERKRIRQEQERKKDGQSKGFAAWFGS
ncbi:uncharacterized protein N0V89_005287 [Didymosphaeria variabile]|uniref:ADP-ribosylglycohydrolase n=1 Tax=Didymosphaeria variabile TaxID=1932322 RepID=A0A9W9CB26_9PLEO|nr:uncharacterized protein N0V89_005287 [Didymosphaeria variabile]KAJ4353557.1 hypothetical protein N0V89_005287 [Didymosphaeria variabile]